MNNKKIIDRIDQLILKGNETILDDNFKSENFSGFKASVLSFVNNVYGDKHPIYETFKFTRISGGIRVISGHSPEILKVKQAIEILKSIKEEVESGWLVSFKNIVSAEIFESYMEMAEHLIEKKYKDPAAVIIGSTLESKLRQLCEENEIDLETTNYKNKKIPKKAGVLNADLCKKEVYNKIVQQQVTTWYALRNSAAHGKYDEYDLKEVKLMYQGVLGFISKHT